MGFFDWFGGHKKRKDQKEKPLEDQIGLGELVRGMQYVVNSATEQVQQHYSAQLQKFFSDDGRPYVKRIILPDNKHVLDIPLAALSPPSGLTLTKMTVETRVRVNRCIAKRAHQEKTQNPYDRASLGVSIANRGQDEKDGYIDIRMEFEAGTPPDAAERIVEELTNFVVPKPVVRSLEED